MSTLPTVHNREMFIPAPARVSPSLPPGQGWLVKGAEMIATTTVDDSFLLTIVLVLAIIALLLFILRR